MTSFIGSGNAGVYHVPVVYGTNTLSQGITYYNGISMGTMMPSPPMIQHFFLKEPDYYCANGVRIYRTGSHDYFIETGKYIIGSNYHAQQLQIFDKPNSNLVFEMTATTTQIFDMFVTCVDNTVTMANETDINLKVDNLRIL